MKKQFNCALLMMCCCALPTLAYAYVGPGAGLSAIGAILAFLGAIFLLIVGFFWYPIKRILKRKKEDRTEIIVDEGVKSDSGHESLSQASKLAKK